MAVRFSADGQDYTRSLSLGSQTQFSLSCWIKISTDRNAFSAFWSLHNGGADSWTALTGADGTELLVGDETAGATLGQLTVGTWYFLGVAVSGVNYTVVLRSATATSFTVQTGSDASANTNMGTLQIGESNFGGEWLNGCIAALKLWTGVTLTQAELENEARTYVPQRMSGIKAWYPFTRAETTDYSGQAQTLSGGSGAATEDGPPIAWRQGRRQIGHPLSVSVEATPGVIAAPWTIPTPSLSTGASTAPGVIQAPWTLPTPTVETLDDVPTQAEPDVIQAPWTLPSPTVEAFKNVTVAPSPVEAPWTVPEPVVTVPVNPGDQITASGQIEWNGFLLGGGTAYGLSTLEGWYDLPGIDPGNVAHPTRHGAYAGRDLGQERIVIYSGLTKAPRDEWEEVVEDLIMATAVGEDDTEYPLAVRLLANTYVGYGKVTRRAVPIDKRFPLGHSNTVIQWTLSDPRLLSRGLNSAVIEDGETQSLTNLGNTATSPLIRCPGPATAPQLLVERLVNGEVVDERLLEFDLTVDDGETLIIDVKLGTAAIGTDDQISTLTGTSVPIPDLVLPAGSCDFSFTTEEGDAPACTVLWRHAIM